MYSNIVPPLILVLFLTFYGNVVDVAAAVENPFTPKGYLLRYWSKQISNDLPKPDFLLKKASPLTAAQSAAFTKLVTDDPNSLSTQLPDFCAKANLLCFSDAIVSPSLQKQGENVDFASYSNINFTNYGTDHHGGGDKFQSYSEGDNVIQDSFRRYSRDSTDHNDTFTSYANQDNVVDQKFNTYGTTAKGGQGKFDSYNNGVNVRSLHFTSYSDNTKDRKQTFTGYANFGNAGDQQFTSYGKNSNDAANEFTNYGEDSNVLSNVFTNYAENGKSANDTFTTYSTFSNVPDNTFKNYGSEGNAAVENFNSYRDQSNVGDDNFQSYAKKSHGGKVDFVNYGQSFNDGSDTFSGYGENNATGLDVAFKTYGVNSNFTDYSKKGHVQFSTYVNDSSSPVLEASLAAGDKKVNKWVEPGKFFREEMLKSGTLMPMPDIRDKMPKRSFLPRTITSKLPFSTSKLDEMKMIFHAAIDSTMEKMLIDSLNDCERAPNADETKRCVTSIEDMIDFATEVLGRNVVVRTTENTQGSNANIMIGSVTGINGGNVTQSVSCHESLFPYLMYYCHSVPKVRVYEADILDPETKDRINRGVAICHLDTSSWSPDHGAFIALGSSPGKIEVCHWIFENDMTWTTAD